jgi:hypothetical protein
MQSTYIAGHRHDRRPVRAVIRPHFSDHPHRPLTQLRQVIARSTCHRSIFSSRSGASGHTGSIQSASCWPSGGAAANQPPAAAAVSWPAGHVAVSREYPPGDLSAGIAAAAAISAGTAPAFAAAHRAWPPARRPACRPAPSQVRAAHAHHPAAAFPVRGPHRSWALGISMLLSSRWGERGRNRFVVGGAVAEHRPQRGDPSSGEGDECLLVVLAFGAFAVIERAGRRTVLQAG